MNIDKKLLEYFNGDELAASTWKSKYALSGETTPEDMHRRMAKEFARIEEKYSETHTESSEYSNYYYKRTPLSEDAIFTYFDRFKYIIPGGSVMSGLGSSSPVSLSNCFVIDSPIDSYEGIMKTRTEQVQLMKRRGGVGYDLSTLRPRGAIVNNSAKISTGAASFMEVTSELTRETAQEGRRGALLLSLSILHPDIEEFIEKKQDLKKVTGANVSVKITDSFMRAVSKDEDFILRFPISLYLNNIKSEELSYGVLSPVRYQSEYSQSEIIGWVKKIKAKELWNKLIHCAWQTAEPGILFESTMHDYSPDGVYHNFKMLSTNPCGEIGMGPYDSCRLIHINLPSIVKNPFTEKAFVDKEFLYKLSYEAMRLADDLVDLEVEAIDKILTKIAPDWKSTYYRFLIDSSTLELKTFLNKYSDEFNLWWKIKETTLQGRRAGLGFTGLADLVAMCNINYNSSEAVQLVDSIMVTLFKGQLDSQLDMAIERGAFPAWDKNLEMFKNSENLLCGFNLWYNSLSEEFPEEFEKMFNVGRRNLSWSTIAPTGTVSILAGTSSGIEPVFLPFYERKRRCNTSSDRVDFIDNLGEKFTKFIVVHHKLKEWALYKYPEEDNSNWTLEKWEEVFKNSPYYKATAPDISWKNRVVIQSAIQKYITHSISSTINLPNEITEETVNNIYLNAFYIGNKGQTVYRDGCREGILQAVSTSKPLELTHREAPKRPKELEADYYQVKVKGEQFIVLVGLYNNKPYEIFAFRPLNTVNIENHKGVIKKISKMHYSFDSKFISISDIQLANTNIEENAATLYSSMLLRHGVPIEYIVKTAKKVNVNITSFSSAMCRILGKYINKQEVKNEPCPNCGGRLVRESGCVKCLDCEYSRCE